MRGIGAFGGFVLAAVASACSGTEPDSAAYVLATPVWSPEPVFEVELADPRAPHAGIAGDASAGANLQRGTRVQVPAADPRSDASVSSSGRSCIRRVPASPNALEPKKQARPVDAYADCTLIFGDDLLDVDIEATLTLSNGRSPTRFFLVSGQPFRFHNLHAGTATLTILLGSSNVELLRVENITIPENGPALDARLGNLDLRGIVRPLRTRLFRPNGQPASRFRFRAADADGHWASGHTDADGWVRLALPVHFGAVDATVRGFQSVRLFDGYAITLAAQ